MIKDTYICLHILLAFAFTCILIYLYYFCFCIFTYLKGCDTLHFAYLFANFACFCFCMYALFIFTIFLFLHLSTIALELHDLYFIVIIAHDNIFCTFVTIASLFIVANNIVILLIKKFFE